MDDPPVTVGGALRSAVEAIHAPRPGLVWRQLPPLVVTYETAESAWAPLVVEAVRREDAAALIARLTQGDRP